MLLFVAEYVIFMVSGVQVEHDDSLENINLTTQTSCSEEHEVYEERHPYRPIMNACAFSCFSWENFIFIVLGVVIDIMTP